MMLIWGRNGLRGMVARPGQVCFLNANTRDLHWRLINGRIVCKSGMYHDSHRINLHQEPKWMNGMFRKCY